MTKEELIKQAWGELMPNYNSFDLSDGWSLGVFNEDVDYSKFDRVYYKIGFVIRPKSLQGIENNNGWIKIESEDDLPKEGMTNYLVCIFNNPSIHPYNLNQLLMLFKDRMITHYQPIITPKPPLF